MFFPGHSWEAIVAEAKEVLRDRDIKTYGQFKSKLAGALRVTVDELKQHKASLQEIIAQEAQKENTTSDEEPQDQEESKSSSQAEDLGEEEKRSKAMAAMRAMARAMNLGPQPFRGLKEMEKTDAESLLKDRLIDAGARFKGPFPSLREIAQTRRKTETEKDLDGIDPGNVVQGSRRRGRFDNEIIAPNKKLRGPGSSVGGCDRESFEKDSSGDEDSEEEFQLSA